jgi:hypothetical protein
LKSLLVYFIAFLMLSTSALYFSVAIFGERIESNEAHGLQLGEGQTEGETTESKLAEQEHPQAQETVSETHNESGETLEQRLQEGPTEQGNERTPNQTEANESKNIEGKHVEGKGTEEGLHQESPSETQRKNLEFPLSVGAGVGYAAIGLWMILDNRNSKIPYIIAVVGSLILLGIYVASRTVGILTLGLEPVGLLDLIVGMLQGGIIVGSSYVFFTKTYAIRE